MQGVPDGVFDLALHRSYAFQWRTLIALIAVFSLIGSTSFVVIAQDATPAAPESTGGEQATVDVGEPIADTTTNADTAEETIDQSGGAATGDESTGGETDTSGTNETDQISSVEPTATGDTLDDTPPILPNHDWLEATSETDSVTLDPGVDHAYAFIHYVTTYRSGTAIHAELRHADGSIAYGWRLSAQVGGGEWAGGDAIVDVSELEALLPDTAFTLSLIVTTPAEVTAEQTVSLWVSSTASTERGETETGIVETGPLATLTVIPAGATNTIVATPTATDFALSCTPPAISQAAGEVQTVSCTFRAEPTLSARSVTLDSIAFAVPTGWTLTNPSNGTLDGNALNFSPAPTISTSQSIDVSFDVTPSCTASTAAVSLNLASSFTAYGTSIPGPGQSIDLTRSAGEAVISVGFADTAPFAFGNATVSGVIGDTVTGSAALTVDRAACAEGAVSIQVSSEQGTNFDPAAAETGAIPLQNISMSNVTVRSGDAYISTATNGGPMTSASTVANVTAGETTSQYQVDLDLSLFVPAGTPSGTYNATLIVDVVSDGDPG